MSDQQSRHIRQMIMDEWKASGWFGRFDLVINLLHITAFFIFFAPWIHAAKKLGGKS